MFQIESQTVLYSQIQTPLVYIALSKGGGGATISSLHHFVLAELYCYYCSSSSSILFLKSSSILLPWCYPKVHLVCSIVNCICNVFSVSSGTHKDIISLQKAKKCFSSRTHLQFHRILALSLGAYIYVFVYEYLLAVKIIYVCVYLRSSYLTKFKLDS